MKNRLLLSASFCAVILAGCLPREQITGRVINTTGPVPGTAVLGMVWIEDAAQARPAPATKDLKPEDRDAVLQKDMKDRGLPVAYVRTFADNNGWFKLDGLHFSAETKKAVKGMQQPKITRITMWAFQRGYRKQAVTLFPMQENKEISPATMLLTKPNDWKELYRDNTVDTLTQDYMVKGYSKEFGATEQEKDWILEYTHSNLWKAYVESNIKGDKEMTEMCGRDYSNLEVSSAGMQRNPEHERCAELKQRMGAVREIEELWIAHAKKNEDPLAAAKEVVKRAIALLPSEASEPKEYESMILAGIEDAANAKNKGAVNATPGLSWAEEAKLQYGRGDKAAAYRLFGGDIYTQLPVEIMQGELTAQAAIRTIPGIKETAAGFYLLMNRPLTAQLPGGDGGNHKDKPKAEVDKSSETIKTEKDEIEIDTSAVRFIDGEGNLRKKINLNAQATRKMVKANAGKELELEIIHSKTPVTSKNKKYVLISEKTLTVPANTKEPWEYGYSESYEVALYGTDGTLLYEKQFPQGVGFPNGKRQITVSDTGIVALIGENDPMEGNYWTKLYVYDKAGAMILTYPDDKTIIGSPYEDEFEISPNGRYLSARVRFPYPEGIVMVFFDLKKKVWWKSKRDYAVYYVDDNGVAHVSYPNPNIPDGSMRKQVKEEDLIIEEYVYLKKHLGD